MDIDWTDTGHAILTLLDTGRCTVDELVELSGDGEKRIRNRLAVLVEAGYVRPVSGRSDQYELVDDPREK